MIFDCLEDNDISLIPYSTLNVKSLLGVRKLAAKFLLDLIYDNQFVQLVFCDILGIIPTDGKVLNCLKIVLNRVGLY